MEVRPTIMRASSAHADEICQLLAIQLREHHVDIEEETLGCAIRGVFENPERGFFSVLTLDERVIGVAYVSFIWALEHGGKSAWLEELYITPEFRGAGLGERLLQFVMADCAALECAALDLEIDADHERVRSLYERHKFERLPRRRLVKRIR